MILKNKIIKHDRFLDVCFKVVWELELDDKIKLKGYWINMGFDESYLILSKTSRIEINKKNLKYWKYCLNTNYKCYRYSDWKEL